MNLRSVIYYLLCRGKKQAVQVEEEAEQDTNDSPELTHIEIDLAKQNFAFYCAGKKGPLELFELPMVLSACGYNKVTPH